MTKYLSVFLLAILPLASLAFLPLQQQHSVTQQPQPRRDANAWGVATSGRAVSSTLASFVETPANSNNIRNDKTRLHAVNIIIAGGT